MGSYQIVDEPRPSPFAHIAVRPLWPLFAVMFVSPAFSWIWFLVNGFAVGSPTRLRETLLAAAGFVGSLAFLLFVSGLHLAEVIGEGVVPYLLDLRLLWQLGVSYMLYVWQSRTFGIYEYYGGVVRNGMPFLIVAYLLWRQVLAPALDAVPVLKLLLGS